MSQFKLYEINDLLLETIEQIEQIVNPETGEIPDDWAEFLDAVQMERNEKALDCARYHKSCTAESEAIKKEIDRLQARRKACERRAESIKNYMQCMVRPGEKIKDANASISWRKSESVDIISPLDVPEEFCKIVKEPSKSAIKDAIKAGQSFPWAIIKTKTNIQIQ